MNMVAVLLLAAGTYSLRVLGPALRRRGLPERAEELMSTGATVLLVALIATASVMDGQRFAGVALPVGVLLGGVLAWRKAPFIVVVVAAAACTAGLRLLGVP